jgi:hypothetical protein
VITAEDLWLTCQRHADERLRRRISGACPEIDFRLTAASC